MNAAYVIVGASLAPPPGARLSPPKARSSAAEERICRRMLAVRTTSPISTSPTAAPA